MATIGTTIIIEPTTEAAISPQFGITSTTQICSVISTGYQGIEKSTVEVWNESTNTWAPALSLGVGYALDVNTNFLDFWSTGGIFRINKEATINAVGVTLREYQ